MIQTIVGDEVSSVMVTLKFAWDGKEIQIHYLVNKPICAQCCVAWFAHSMSGLPLQLQLFLNPDNLTFLTISTFC